MGTIWVIILKNFKLSKIMDQALILNKILEQQNLNIEVCIYSINYEWRTR